jgi:protein-S-isoprenylcysteine O-methyltransferase Ste14
MVPLKTNWRGHGPEKIMKDKKGEHPFGDAGQMVLMVLFLAVWLGDSFFLHAGRTLGGSVHWAIRLAILIAAVALATVLFRSGHVALQDEQRPARVLKNGAFRWLRHPLYLASLLVCLGLSLATQSLWSLAVTLLIFIFLNHIAAFEEKVMEEKFGDEYREYKGKTGRWWPKLLRSK